MNKRIQQIDNRIELIKKSLVAIDAMRPGVISRQYSKYGNEKRGYYQISFTYKMKSKTEYLRPEFVGLLKKQVENYKLFKRLIKEWVGLSIEHSKLDIKQKINQNAL
jgi:hypothetical protein